MILSMELHEKRPSRLSALSPYLSTDILLPLFLTANTSKSDTEVAFKPARVILQDFTGVPAVVDLAAMRDATKRLGSDPAKINPHVPVDLVVDHSVQVRIFIFASEYRPFHPLSTWQTPLHSWFSLLELS